MKLGKAGVEMVLPLMPPDRRRSLLGTVTDLYQRLSSKSTMKVALLRFIEKMFASSASYTQQHSTEPAIPRAASLLVDPGIAPKLPVARHS